MDHTTEQASDRLYQAHRRRGEPACPNCKAAHSAYTSERAALHREANPKPRPGPAPCGTVGGHAAHTRRHEPICDPCKAAWNEYVRTWYAENRKKPKRELQPCGTPAAYRRHLRHGEEPCDDCKEAHYGPNRKDWKEP